LFRTSYYGLVFQHLLVSSCSCNLLHVHRCYDCSRLKAHFGQKHNTSWTRMSRRVSIVNSKLSKLVIQCSVFADTCFCSGMTGLQCSAVQPLSVSPIRLCYVYTPSAKSVVARGSSSVWQHSRSTCWYVSAILAWYRRDGHGQTQPVGWVELYSAGSGWVTLFQLLMNLHWVISNFVKTWRNRHVISDYRHNCYIAVGHNSGPFDDFTLSCYRNMIITLIMYSIYISTSHIIFVSLDQRLGWVWLGYEKMTYLHLCGVVLQMHTIFPVITVASNL